MTYDHYVHKTYEPFKFLGRFTVFPIAIKKKTPVVTLTATHEADPPWRWAPTVVVRLWPLPFGVGVGWWLDTDIENLQQEFAERVVVEETKAEYDRYVTVNGPIDFAEWAAAREKVISNNGDPEDPLEIQMNLEHH